MRLRNTREPYDVVEHDNEDRIKFLLKHGYVEAINLPIETLSNMPIGKEYSETIQRRGKKTDQPPADLGELADDLSKGEDSD